jgi:uncharacterized membrane protein
VARAHVRLLVSALVGLIVFVALPTSLHDVTRMLIGWDTGVLIYLVAAFAMMARATAEDISDHSEAQDEGAATLLILTVAAAVASLGAIFVELATSDPKESFYGLHVALAIGTVVLSWAFIQTILALHYAYEFYGDSKTAHGLKFPDDDKPDYWDFVYFAFVIGMTFQVSDVAVTSKAIRRMVVAHGVLAFFFATAIVALTVNIAANALQK